MTYDHFDNEYDETILDNAELFCDGASGVYIPQRFAQEVTRELVTGVSEWCWAQLEKGPNTDEAGSYWDAWDQTLNNAVINHPTLGKCYLWQDGDLWIVPKDA